MGQRRLFLGVDVGTGSVRAGLFDEEGHLQGMGIHPIQTFRPEEDFVEQSSEDIWHAAGKAVREALVRAKAEPSDVAGIGFDATCSLVVVDGAGRPVTVSPTGRDEQNVIVWMDHRAQEQTARINQTGHEVLKYVGGGVSPEMETPKLLWLKERLPATWSRAAAFFDLPDYLVFRATGEDVRSLCTTVCKWTYQGHVAEGGWSSTYFEQIGLGDLAREGFRRIGTRVSPLGERAGMLTSPAATELGLVAGIPVGVAIIDAHAGGLGLLGISVPTYDRPRGAPVDFDTRLALIGGTSTCHMAVSKEPRFIPGVWGPYFSAMVPGYWLTEGGQSATGALLEHVVFSHARGEELRAEAAAEGVHAYDILNERLEGLIRQPGRGAFHAALTRDVHVLADHHGNRSPRADATLRGMVSGLSLESGLDALALLYQATVQAIAYGTRHILESLNQKGYGVTTLLATGGDCKNPVFLREHADATGCRIVLPREGEAVLLGAAMLGAAAATGGAGKGAQALATAMGAMNASARVVEPAGGVVKAFHDAKFAVYLRLHDDQMAYRTIMAGIRPPWAATPGRGAS